MWQAQLCSMVSECATGTLHQQPEYPDPKDWLKLVWEPQEKLLCSMCSLWAVVLGVSAWNSSCARHTTSWQPLAALERAPCQDWAVGRVFLGQMNCNEFLSFLFFFWMGFLCVWGGVEGDHHWEFLVSYCLIFFFLGCELPDSQRESSKDSCVKTIFILLCMVVSFFPHKVMIVFYSHISAVLCHCWHCGQQMLADRSPNIFYSHWLSMGCTLTPL